MSDDPSPGGHTSPTAPAVLISDRQSAPVDVDALASLARQTLLAEGLSEVELSLSFVDEAEMEDLHVRYLDEPGPTDVLSFPLDGEDERGGPPSRPRGRPGIGIEARRIREEDGTNPWTPVHAT